jgi:hypothetical protein
MAEFDLAERIPLLTYTISHDKELLNSRLPHQYA